MPKQGGQKHRLLLIRDILFRYSDSEHLLTRRDLEEKLSLNGMEVDKKTLYDDLTTVGVYKPDGLSDDEDALGDRMIRRKLGRDFGYGIPEKMRLFSISELKLLVDAVLSAKFLTDRQSEHIIRKLESMCSVYQAKQLRRQVYIPNRERVEQTAAFENVDVLNRAITEDRQVRFRYFKHDRNKNRIFGHDGAKYRVSPWALTWDDGKYYLIGDDMDSKDRSVRHYRVDKMVGVELSEDCRSFSPCFEGLRTDEYKAALFSMFGGEINNVTLVCHNRKIDIILDRFGMDTMLIPEDRDHFKVHVRVIDSDQFYSWIISLGPDVRVAGPDPAVQKMKAIIRRLNAAYPEE